MQDNIFQTKESQYETTFYDICQILFASFFSGRPFLADHKYSMYVIHNTYQ